MTQPTIWGDARRGAAVIGGLTSFVLSLVLGATIIAQGATRDGFARGLVIAFVALGLLGLYVAASGTWGGWSPARTQTRIRSVRIVLAWAILVGAYMCWGLPLGSMSKAEWANFVILAVLLCICITSFVGIASRARATVVALGVAAAYGAFSSIKLLIILLLASAGGPATALAFLLAGSFNFALVVAFALAWPLLASVAVRSVPQSARESKADPSSLRSRG